MEVGKLVFTADPGGLPSGVADLSGIPDMFHTTERPRLNSRSYVSYTLVQG